MANLKIKSLRLYTAPLSGCSARVRITSHLKSIPLTHHNIDISSAQQSTPSYKAINPNASVPSLIVEIQHSDQSGQDTFVICQSPAILDFLESHYPNAPLFPKLAEQWRKRAQIFELASLVACDIQPPQNIRLRQKIVTDFGGDGEEWARYVYGRGFNVYEKLVQRSRASEDGKYSVGNDVTLADVFLIPAAQGALRVGLDLGKWPSLARIVEECWKLDAFRKGGLGEHGRLIP